MLFRSGDKGEDKDKTAQPAKAKAKTSKPSKAKVAKAEEVTS